MASSAASGTPSTAKKNQMPNGSAASTPLTPNGRNELEPADPSAAMLSRFAASKCGIMPVTNAMSATMAIAVMANITLSASPTPIRWMAMNSAKHAP